MGLLLAWRDGVSAAAAGGGAVAVTGPGGRVTLRGLGPGLLGAVARLDPPGDDEDRLAGAVVAGGGELPRWFFHLDRLTRNGLVGWSAHEAGARLATLTATAPGFATTPVGPAADGRYALSRFAYLRRLGDAAVVETPLAPARVTLADGRAAALVGALAAPAAAAELAARAGLSAAAAAGVLTLLLRGGMAVGAGAAEECDPALRTWAFHDLLFHARSRKGRSDAAYGGTYRFAGGDLPMPPALKPTPAGEAVPLARPDRPGRDDPPLGWVLEHRRSVREFDRDRPVTAGELGEFLYRVNRVTDRRAAEVPTARGPVAAELAARPYPAGGGLYELEVYAAVNACAGLAPGLYYHEPAGHRLVRVAGRTPAVDGLLRDAGGSTGVPADELQVVLVLAARVPRVAWKYESIAYALVLKHVGVVYQTMYLAATAMGLGACAVGGGDADLFARAAGTAYAAETSVGEFLLGRRRGGPPAGPG